MDSPDRCSCGASWFYVTEPTLMPKALTITRDDYTAAELREAATRGNDADATRRMLALALVLEGYKRGEAGKLCGMDRQTLRDWVIRLPRAAWV
jgi:hypothetical protein